MWEEEASTAREICAEEEGWTRGVADAKADLAAWKAATISPDQSNVLGLPRRESVRGRKMPATPGRNLR